MTDDSGIVLIEPSGSRRGDYVRALAKLRHLARDPQWVVPKGWVMHHAMTCGEIQVIPFELHGENAHTGGFTTCTALRPEPTTLANGHEGPGAFRDGGPPLKERDVRKLEREFGCDLPTAYRKFLLQCNGGRPEHQGLLRATGDAGDIIERFFGLEDAGADTLLGAFDIYSSRIPKGLLPIARDPFGNLILLGLAGPDIGKVFFWDHEVEPMDPSADDAPLALLADAFPLLVRNFRGLSPS